MRQINPTVAASEGVAAEVRYLTPVEASQVGLIWRIVRRISHRLNGEAWSSFVDIDPSADPVVPVAAAAQSAPLAPPAQTRKIKLASMIDQADDTEIPAAETSAIHLWFQEYVMIMGAPPQEEEEPTAEQLQALNHRVHVLKSTPYVDHAVWGPFGRKAVRAGKFRSWALAADGSYVSKELPGPENFTQWLASWRVFVTACVMLKVCSQSSLQLYERTIERLTKTWATSWHLIVLADDKARAEHLERIRRGFLRDSVVCPALVPSDWSESSQ